MANSIDDLTAKITDYAYDASKLAQDKSIISLVKDLENLTKEVTEFGFSAEISQQILPRVNAQREALENLYNQLQSVSNSVSQQLTSIGEVFDNIPYGKLKKMGFDTRVKKANSVSNPVAEDSNGAEIQKPVMAPQGGISSGAPAQSAMLQNESTSFWSSLKTDMGLKSAPVSGGATWDRIMENGDFKNMDLGLLNNVAENNQQTSFLESITKALPKGAGDLNNTRSNYDEFDDIFTESMKEGDFDAYEEFGIEDGSDDLGNIEYTDSTVSNGVNYDTVPEGTPMTDALYTSEQSHVEPIEFSLASFGGNSAAGDIDFSQMELDESNDDAFSIVPEEVVETTTHMKENKNPIQTKHNFASEEEVMSKILG